MSNKFTAGKTRYEFKDASSRVSTWNTDHVNTIESYVTNAASPSSPYLISTQRRFTALKDKRSSIVERVTGAEIKNARQALEEIALSIRDEEEKHLKEFMHVLGVSTFSELVDILEESFDKRDDNSYGKSIEEAIKIINQFFYAFNVGNYNDKKFQELMFKQIDDFLRYGKEISITNLEYAGDKGPGHKPNYKFTFSLDDVQEAYQRVYDAIDNENFYYDDPVKISRVFSYLTQGLVKMKDKKGTDQWSSAIKDGVYDTMMGDLIKARDKAISKLKAGSNKDPILKLDKNRYLVGYLNEFLVDDAIARGFSEFAIENKFNNLTEENLKEGILNSLSVTDPSLKSHIYKTIDSIIELKNERGSSQLLIDHKWSSKRHRDRLKTSAVYATNIEVDYGKGLKDLLEDSSSEVVNLYRSLLVNITATSSYRLSPEEKTALLYREISKKDTIDKKFQIQAEGLEGRYPMIVIANSQIVRFSDAIAKFASIDRVMGMDDATIPKYSGSLDFIKDFKDKVSIGRSTGKEAPNFIDRVHSVRERALSIEEGYLKLPSNKQLLRFIIK